MSEGKRYDQGKARPDLLPWSALAAVSKVLTFGAKKYEDHNWAKGMPWSKVVSPMLRHFIKWVLGERYDKESGQPHLAHIATNALYLLTYELHSLGTDDRLILPMKPEDFEALLQMLEADNG